MAKVTTYTDDVTPDVTDGVREVTLTVRDSEGEFNVRLRADLGPANAEALSKGNPKVLAAFFKVAEKVAFTPASGADSDTAKVREWARRNGHTVSDRGALPQAVKDAYAAAHPAGHDSHTTSGDDDE